MLAVQREDEPSRAEFVNIVYLKAGKLYRVKARSAVVAGGSWTTKHIVKDLPETHRKAYAQFYRSPCMMANVALRNWHFFYKMGVSGCRWFEGLAATWRSACSRFTGVADPTIGPDSSHRSLPEGSLLLSGTHTEEREIGAARKCCGLGFHYQGQIREKDDGDAPRIRGGGG